MVSLHSHGVLMSTTTNSKGATMLIRQVVSEVASRGSPTSMSHLLIIACARTTTTRVGRQVNTTVRGGLRRRPKGIGLRRRSALVRGTSVVAVRDFYLSIVQSRFRIVKVSPTFHVTRRKRLHLLVRSILRRLVRGFCTRKSRTFLGFISRCKAKEGSRGVRRLVLRLCRCSEDCPRPRG